MPRYSITARCDPEVAATIARFLVTNGLPPKAKSDIVSYALRQIFEAIVQDYPELQFKNITEAQNYLTNCFGVATIPTVKPKLIPTPVVEQRLAHDRLGEEILDLIDREETVIQMPNPEDLVED